MRLLAFVAIFAGAAATAAAQTPTPTPTPETYQISPTVNQQTQLTEIVTAANERVCWDSDLPSDCSQSDACVAKGLPSGCTANQARSAGVRIYPLTQAGREEYVQRSIVAPEFIERRAGLRGHYLEKMCRNWEAFDASQREALCAAAGLPSTCNLCNGQ